MLEKIDIIKRFFIVHFMDLRNVTFQKNVYTLQIIMLSKSLFCHRFYKFMHTCILILYIYICVFYFICEFKFFILTSVVKCINKLLISKCTNFRTKYPIYAISLCIKTKQNSRVLYLKYGNYLIKVMES